MDEEKYGPKTEFAKETHARKYRGKGESFDEYAARVSDTLADDDEHYYKLRDILRYQRFLPGGRIQSAIGSPRNVTAFNCFTAPTIEDSMEGIMDVAKYAALTMKKGGGIGYDFSTIRGSGSHIVSLDSPASGPLSFMEIFNATCKTVSSAGNRRGAQMGVLRIDHPDIEAFVEAKANTDKLTAFNISIAITDEFMHAVENGDEFELKFNGEVKDKVDARRLWDKIMRTTWDWAEPGVLFIDRINDMNNLYYCEEIYTTNPCVHPRTVILTDRGYTPIGRHLDTKVNVWNGFEFSTVEIKETGQDQPMKFIEFSDGSDLECTDYHLFHLYDGSKVEAKDLKIGDKLLKHEWPVIESGEDKSDAYEQGFFSGDGWFKGHRRAYIGLYGDKKSLVSSFKGFKSKGEYKINGGYLGTDTGETKIYFYYGEKFDWGKDFVPSVEWSLRSRKEWLRGLMDSDGYVTKDGNAQISSRDRSFLKKVKYLLNSMGATGTLSPIKDYWRLSIPASYYYDLNIGCRHGSKKPSRSATRFIQISSIEDAGICDRVFCFTEPKNGTGIFGGILTGQCGEQPLPPNGACLLGSFNLVKYVDNNSFDWELFGVDIHEVVRAMDNVIDRTTYPLPQQEVEAKSKRRIGIGITGLANALEYLGYSYGSEEFLKFEDTLLSFLANESYMASSQLAIEKGSFPLFDPVYYPEGKFIKRLDTEVQEHIMKYGIRNSHLLSVAPTGTISICADNVSSGIEPPFSLEYDRTIIKDDETTVERVIDYGHQFLGVCGKTSDECTIDEHLGVLTTAQYWVDSACSKTINVGDDVTWEEFKDVYMRAWKGGAKGVTTFRASGKRYGILNKSSSACYIDKNTGKRTCDE